MTRKKIKKAGKIVKIAFRIFFCLVFLHWKYLTVYDDYYYYSAIRGTKNHAEINCHGKSKSIEEIRDAVLSKIREYKGESKHPSEADEITSEEWKEGDKLIEEIKDKEKALSKEWRFLRSKKEKDELTELQKKYQVWLEGKGDKGGVKERVCERIKKQLEEGELNITLLDTKNESQSWFKRAWKDPVKFLFLNQFNRVSAGLKGHLWLEIIFKLLMVELFLLGISYPSSLEKFQKISQKLENPALSMEEKSQISTKFPTLLIQGVTNLFLFLLGNFACFIHPLAFDKATGLFGQKAHPIWIVLLFFCNLFFFLSREFFQQRRILTKSEIKTFLAKNWFSILLSFLLAFLFSAEPTHGNNLLIFCSLLVNSLVSVVRGYFDPQLKRN